MNCRNCGAPLAAGQAFCTKCGTPAASDVQGTATASQAASRPINAAPANVSPVVPAAPVPEDPAPSAKSRSVVPILAGMVAVLAAVLVGIIVMRPDLLGMGGATQTDEGAETEAASEDSQDNQKEQETDESAADEAAKEEQGTAEEKSEEPADSEEEGQQIEFVLRPESGGSGTATGNTTGLQQTTAPAFNDAEASSTLPPDKYTSYYGPLNAIDGDSRTAWNEGATGNGVGEWLTLRASSPQVVQGVRIIAGYPKSEEVYYWNNRPQNITIELSDGTTQSATLSDSMGEWQTITFDGLHETNYITVRVDSVYAGNKYNDTSFAEVVAF